MLLTPCAALWPVLELRSVLCKLDTANHRARNVLAKAATDALANQSWLGTHSGAGNLLGYVKP